MNRQTIDLRHGRYFQPGRQLAVALWSLICMASASVPTHVFAQDQTQGAVAAQIEKAPQENSAAAETQRSDIKFQSTYIWQQHSAFPAAYSGPNSLVSTREPRSYTLSATAFMGTRIWEGGELYFNPEMISSQSLSNLHGLGALSNGENQKGGGPNPIFYRARLFVRHTWGMGGGSEQVESAPNQLAGTVDKNRVVLTAGNVALTDLFDDNNYSHDSRTQFENWALMTNGAIDYAADARGYTVGATLEYYRDDWAFRVGRFEQPIESNGLVLDSQIMRHYGDDVEVEHQHNIGGQPGKLRLLAFHNHAKMGNFRDAINAWRAVGSVGVPDLANVRRESGKIGYGANLEQALTGDIGLFLRASWNDGQTETYAFTEIERSVSGGLSIKGTAWNRPNDVAGIGLAQNGLSAEHREYLANGGLGAFIGDGAPPAGMVFHYANEQAAEFYYNANVVKGLWITLDYQYIRNPAYNADRGPVNIVGGRLHTEF